MKKYLLNTLIGFDQWINALAGGDAQETISSRAGRQAGTRWWAGTLCWALDKLEAGHCANAVKNLDGHLKTDESVLP